MSRTRVFIIAAHESHFFAFRKTQQQSAPYMVYIKKSSDLRLSGTSRVMCVGPFWTHPCWEELLAIIRRQTLVNPLIMLEWFPMVLTLGLFIAQVVL